MSDPQTIIWTIPELGVSTTESALLDFGIRHITNTAGLKKVNQSITYTDNEGNVVIFPDPSVMVDCDIVIYPEECPEPIDLSVDNCRDASIVDLGETYMESLGRIVEVSATIKNICPGKRVAAAFILTETDEEGMEYQRGMKPLRFHPMMDRDVGTFSSNASNLCCQKISIPMNTQKEVSVPSETSRQE